MTDKTAHEVTNEDRRRARDWAWQVEADPDAWVERLRTAARVILADIPAPTPPTTEKEAAEMPDQTLDDQLRPILGKWERIKEHADWEDMNNLVQAIRALLPARPTLADMTEDERVACRRMQCDYALITRNTTSRGVIGYFDHEGKNAVILTDTCGIVRRNYASVTPRPDLPRLEWPGDTPAPALALPPGWKLADHEKYGRVVVTSDTPDADGHVYFVAPASGTIGNDWHLCQRNELAYLDNER